MIYPENASPDPNQPDQQAQPGADARIGFCQHCGKPLTRDTVRKIGDAVYCEPCLAERIAGAPGAVPPAGQPGYTPVEPAFTGWSGSVQNGTPNPGLAALLGFIPGVGAMYNGQYAKGVVHLIVFAVLVSLADNENGIFGIFVAGWMFYMVIEAHHTARARRDGAPLPNPFGLNDLGERLGFGRSWASPGPFTPPVANPSTPPSAAGYPAYTPPVPDPYAPSQASWGAPQDAYQYNYGVPPVPPSSATYQPYAQVPPVDPQAYAAGAPLPPFVPAPNRFPAGAIWLIGLGVIFLIGNTGIFRAIGHDVLGGLILIAVGAWIFIRKMTGYGHSFAPDGTEFYRWRVFRAARASIWIVVAGLILLFSGFHMVRWSHMWPWFIILIGVMTLLERTTLNAAAAAPTYPGPVPTPYAGTDASVHPVQDSASIVPYTRRDEEGR